MKMSKQSAEILITSMTLLFFPLGYFMWYKKNREAIHLVFPIVLTLLTTMMPVLFYLEFPMIFAWSTSLSISMVMALYVACSLLTLVFLIMRMEAAKYPSRPYRRLNGSVLLAIMSASLIRGLGLLTQLFYRTAITGTSLALYLTVVLWTVTVIYLLHKYSNDAILDA